MKPPDFAYHRPATVEETVGLLAKPGAATKVLAGGQSLIPMLNMRLVAPSGLVDITRLRDVPAIDVDGGRVRIGATVRQRQAETDPVLRERCPLIAQALAHVAHRAVRTRGTVVGSVAHADPAAELPAVVALLDGSVTAVSEDGSREIESGEFFRGYFETALRSDELALAVSLRTLQPGEGSAFVELARRQGDFALCGVAAVVAGSSARVALAGVDAVPRVFDVSPALDGDETVLDELASALEPEADVHASGDYRRHLARELTRRAVRAAREGARR